MKKKLCFILFLFLSLYPLFSCLKAEVLTEEGITINAGQKWAFLIGISDYKDPEIADLNKAQNAEKDLAWIIKEHGGFDQVIVFTDDLDKNNPRFPSKKGIQSTLSHYAKIIKPEDLILFSFSGHGITDPTGKAFLLTEDTRLKNIARTGLPVEYIMDFIKKTGVKKSIILLDACREKVRKQGDGSGGGVYPDRYLRKGITAIFYSARKGLYSYDHDGSGYGVFATYLISGLEGEADTRYGGNSDGIVTLNELAAYIREGISEWSMESAKKQIPYVRILDKGMGDMIISSAKEPELKEEVIAGAPVQEIEEEREEEEIPEAAPAQKSAEIAEGITVEAPAPTFEEIEEKGEVERVQEIVRAEESMPAEEPEAEAETEVREEMSAEVEVKVAAKEEGIEKEEAVKEKVEETTGEEIIEPAGEESIKEEEPETGIEVTADMFFKKGEEDEQLKLVSIPPDIKPEPLSLRKKTKDLSPKDVRSMLGKYNFYSTCWNHNGDFCNPEGDFENHFVDNHNRTITDEATGLMWQKGGSSGGMTWPEAKDYAIRLNREGFAGYSDWRIPTIEELASLLESSWENGDLFIEKVFDRKQRYCWSQDTSGINKAWKANFHLGFIMDFPMSSINPVRLVRSLP